MEFVEQTSFETCVVFGIFASISEFERELNLALSASKTGGVLNRRPHSISSTMRQE